ncbi:hypothetical protein LX32DRAFT_635603 [Colletotrichum zoysiae]|uniref:Uncharacterized protein n=1 Tax=Colletotrichum zoysiae TaxID=1216348 RepID=A0AAD9M8X2_9PEZI|nr:hypothetical protein LX32DRAFT_635603 [Colletotrichum zoysiae]
MSDTNSLVSGDMITHHHASPAQFALAHASSPGQDRETPGTVPFSSQPFSYAQAQQYVQSLADTGTFGFPPPPSIPSPSPIRIFRWPTRSSRSGASTPSAFTGRRSNKAASRHQSQHSRSTISSMLWHGRRDIIARSTMNRTPVLPKPSFASNNSPESPMQDSVHTPVLDWLHWIRGHQQVEPDPEMNHRKSFASTTDSAPSEISHARSASTASSGVFSHKVLSLQPPSTTPCETPEEGLHADADSFQYIPMPLFKRADSNAGGSSGSSGSVAPSGVSITQPR